MRKLTSFLLIAILAASMAVYGTNRTDITNSETDTPITTTSADREGTNADNSSYTPSKEYDNVYPQHEPYGTGVGAMPGRVVWSHAPIR